MKSDNARFTVRFNPADSRQRAAIDVLNTSGRRKASLIADALHYYLTSSGDINSQLMPPIIRSDFEQLPDILQPPNTAAIAIPTEQFTMEPDIRVQDSADNSHPHDSAPDDLFSAVLDAMSIFNEQQ